MINKKYLIIDFIWIFLDQKKYKEIFEIFDDIDNKKYKKGVYIIKKWI
ncbi:hypothetical protein [Metamycoplasma hyosynoviae]|nr:hypothetical protein [Metamycoplasma hyosynoviae]MDC8938229.1 hypothetical protein [Metamycoplasma hyosynoviae]MDD7837635.1 hypothetical protein [Metamycoplasma hyosynoviae]